LRAQRGCAPLHVTNPTLCFRGALVAPLVNVRTGHAYKTARQCTPAASDDYNGAEQRHAPTQTAAEQRGATKVPIRGRPGPRFSGPAPNQAPEGPLRARESDCRAVAPGDLRGNQTLTP